MGRLLGVSHARPQKGGVPAVPNFRVPFYSCVHPLSQKYQIWRGNTYGEGTCFNGFSLASTGPYQIRGDAPAMRNFGFPFYLQRYVYTLCRRTTKLDVVTHTTILLLPKTNTQFKTFWIKVFITIYGSIHSLLVWLISETVTEEPYARIIILKLYIQSLKFYFIWNLDLLPAPVNSAANNI